MLEKEKRMAGKILVTESSDRDQFPAGMRVLALDANSVCLKYLVYLLEICRYRVTATTKAEEALQILREKKDKFDIVITDVIRQDIDGFKVLQIVGIEMDMPVIVISADDDQANITRSISHGARDYLLKPVRLQEMRNIWQHVYRKSLNTRQKYSCIAKEIVDPRSFPLKTVEENLKKEEAEAETSTQSNSTIVTPGKKTRLTWSPELHMKFVNAIQELGKDAFPNKLLRMMNVPGLTRQNVASHLQKFRNISKKQSSVVSKQRNPLYSVTDLKDKNTKPRELDMYQNYMPSPHSVGQMQLGIRCQVYGNLPSTPLPTRTYLPESDCQLPDIFPGIQLHDGCMGISSQPSRFSINGGWPVLLSDHQERSFSFSIRKTMGINLSGKNIVYPDNMQDPNLTVLEGKGKARVVQSFPEHSNMESGFHQYCSSFMDDDLSVMVKEFDNDVPPKL